MQPTLGAALTHALEAGRNLGPRGMPVTLERVTQVFEDGRVEVNGTRIPIAGSGGARGVRAGQMIAVSWQHDQPVVAIRHSARRTGPVSPQPRLSEPLVEELWIAPRPGDGVTDVWFRNYDQCVPLQLDRFGIVPTEVVWGPTNDRLLVQSGGIILNTVPIQHTIKYHVMKFQREPFTPFRRGDDAAAFLALERTEDLAASTLVVASLGGLGDGVESISGAALGPHEVKYAPSAFPGVFNIVWAFAGNPSPTLDDEGNVILTWSISSSGGASGGAFQYFQLIYRGTVIVDNTRQLILLDTWSSIAALAELGAGLTPPTAINFGDFAGPVTTISTPPDGLWAYAPGAFFVEQFIYLQPILVTARDGVVGWFAAVETRIDCDAVNLGSGLGEPQCRVVLGPTNFKAQAGVVVRAPGQVGTLVLFPMAVNPSGASTAPGAALAATYHRIVGRRTLVAGLFDFDSGGSDGPGFVTLFSNGSVVQITETIRALGNRGLHILPTDFAYVLDDAAVTQPAEAPVNFFLEAWDFGGATTLSGATATSTLPEDSAMTDIATLAEIPDGVTAPRGGSGTEAALQIVNASSVLDPLGRFEDLP